MRRALLLACGMALVGLCSARAGSPLQPEPEAAELFMQGNAAFREGAYGRATALYVKAQQRGADGGWIAFNRGNALLRDGQLGEAIAAYRQAERDLPRNGDIAANLRYARKIAKDAIAPVAPSAVVRALLFWHFALSPYELGIATLIFNALFWGSLAWRQIRPGSELSQWAAVGLFVLLAATCGSWGIHTLAPARVAVIKEPEVDIHSGLSHDSIVLFRLHEGTEGQVVQRRGDWVHIQLSDGKQGWVTTDDIVVVAM